MDLAAWLNHLENLHPQTIDMGLARVGAVRNVLLPQLRAPIITVAGTNGKGSTCAYLETMLSAAGHQVGLYTSPHLLRFNERIRLNQSEVDDTAICAAFSAIEAARGDISLSYFEFATLAAVWIFERADVDVMILEVGLGGRLDAVNVFDAQVAVVTNIGIDHVDYLGDNRELIGREKAGVFRPQHPAICGDAQPPLSLQAAAQLIGADWHALGHDFNYQVNSDSWDYDGVQKYLNLPLPTMRGAYQINNAATAIAALSYFNAYCLVDEQAIRHGLQGAQVTGRFQVIAQAPMRILDVAHNPHGAEALAANLAQQPIIGKTYAVFAMLSDKDIAGVIAAMREVIDVWVIAELDVPRGAILEVLQAQLHALQIPVIVPQMDIRSAWFYACEHAAENDRICAFGSFYTVAAVLDAVK
ncbi:bifunctional tetrahydrofolate synthase/dihydrofolate synthase [Sulfuriferula nivalis]|uniref:Dihydrofolate synthase/folylpolyglutamate synthase n=1 Tax=Sulfuriferula nivalis TaxID=2675298 RepID=A0A809SEX3_9PROT|nr:bifunctional tetrahydrofolate synthase/dihydrofolate synthase [Sulfuriferula nivalis]BBP01787.1 bifunctional folylpolyglutamate synthase/dihydrofolate synthase [Sulfuriferula nivalis]